MSINFQAYSFPFTRPFKAAGKHFLHRKGVILQLKKEEIQALGEIAPLPGFSFESFEEVKRQLEGSGKRITDFFHSNFTLNHTIKFIRSHSFYPSVEFGLFTLAATFLAQYKKCTLHSLLSSEASHKIPLNAVIGLQSDNLRTQIDEYVSGGFKTIKIKADKAWDELQSQIEGIRSRYPNIKIRIDANQSWSMDEARRYLHEMENLDIEYCEEPLAYPTANAISILREETHVPIALDESLAHTFSLDKAFEIATVLIIKPMVLGLSAMTKDLLKKADKMNTKLVFTSSLDGAVARLLTATLAACFGSPGMAHGLNTGTLLKTDIWSDHTMIKSGHYHLPEAETLPKLMNQDFDKPEYKLILFND